MIEGLNGTHLDQCPGDANFAALIRDMKRYGLLDDTLSVWCIELGRMSFLQCNGTDRNYTPGDFTCSLAGAGMKPGVSHGVTGDIGQKASEDIHPLYHFNATILHLPILDFEHNGMQRRTTRVEGKVFREFLA
jgi:Protein of unknown function (DUF1501)